MSLNLVPDLLKATGSFLQDQQFPSSLFWKSLFTSGYWSSNASANPPTYALFVWGSVLTTMNKRAPIYRSLIVQIWSILIFLTMGVLIYNFSYQQGVPYFSSRLLILIIAVMSLVWAGILIYIQSRIIPVKKQAHLEKERFFRYLPKKKERIVK